MAKVHNSQGNYDEALRLYDQALQTTMKALGPDHADTATILNKWADTKLI